MTYIIVAEWFSPKRKNEGECQTPSIGLADIWWSVPGGGGWIKFGPKNEPRMVQETWDSNHTGACGREVY